MTPNERRDLRKRLVELTDNSSDARIARVAEHLVRVVDEIDLACRPDDSDDSTTRQGLKSALMDTCRDVRSVLDVLQSQQRRRAPETRGTPAQTATVKP